YCEAPIRQCDHIVPLSAGGITSLVNGQGACAYCNPGKENDTARIERVDDPALPRHRVAWTGHGGTTVVTAPPSLGPVAPASDEPTEAAASDSTTAAPTAETVVADADARPDADADADADATTTDEDAEPDATASSGEVAAYEGSAPLTRRIPARELAEREEGIQEPQAGTERAGAEQHGGRVDAEPPHGERTGTTASPQRERPGSTAEGGDRGASGSAAQAARRSHTVVAPGSAR